MDSQGTTQTIDRQEGAATFAGIDSQPERLKAILAANAELDREKVIFRNHREQVEASLMRHPLTTEKAFGYFGLLLGLFPPAAIFIQFLKDGAVPGTVVLLIFVNLICAGAGYLSGRLVGKLAAVTETYSWNKMLLILPLLGMLWGNIAGGAGGIFVFIIGAFFGAFFGAIVGAVAIPAFTIFHRLLKRGEMIEQKHFLPLAFGVTLIISAFILSL